MVLTIEQAEKTILKFAAPLSTISLTLTEAVNCYLAVDIRAPLPIPLFANSAMDGFAVRSADIRRLPTTLKVVEEIPAGYRPRKKLLPGEASLIMTGALLPRGADAVVMVEDTDKFNNPKSKIKDVTVYKKVKKGENVRRLGEVIWQGQILLEKGKLLRPQEIALLAAVNIKKVKVCRRPKVAILSTGSEVVPLGRKLRPGQIIDSNSRGLLVQLMQWGAEVIDLGISSDNRAALTRKIKQGLARADVMVTIGGVSVGKWDYVKDIVASLGRIIFWKVKMKPGGPIIFGQAGRRLFFGLPGNPVSSLIAADLFIKPALQKLRGRREFNSEKFCAILASDYQSRPGKVRLERVRLAFRRGSFYAQPAHSLGSADLRSMTEANGLMFVPAGISKLTAGSLVTVRYF